MNTHSLARGAALAGLALALAACDQGLTEVNIDPNSPTDVSAEYLFPHPIEASVRSLSGAGTLLSHTSIFSEQTVQIQYPAEEIGQVRPSTMQSIWDSFYGWARETSAVIAKGQEGGYPDIEAAGMVWRAWLFSQLTDFYGDIPYSQALQGAENTTPVYDTQKDVYYGMLQNLTDASAMFTSSAAVDFGGGDILYGNDFDKWKMFANSLRMRLAMRLSKADPTKAQTEFVAAYNAGGFTSNDDNAMLTFPGAPYQNPLWANCICGGGGRDDHGMSLMMIDTLVSLNDPRLALYAEPAAFDGQYRGLQNGIELPPLSLDHYSRIGNYWRADGELTPMNIMTYSEVLFLEAEAAEMGWISANAGTLYNQAIQAAMTQYTTDVGAAANQPTAQQITDYMAQARIVYAGGAAGLNQIHLQKWLSLFMQGDEAWADVRRTGVPHITAGPDLVVPGVPIRFYYPDGETALNSANVSSAIADNGGAFNDLTTPLWFMNQ